MGAYTIAPGRRILAGGVMLEEGSPFTCDDADALRLADCLVPVVQAPPVPPVPPADEPPAVENPKPKRGRKPREEAPPDAAQPVPDEDNDAPAEA